MTNIQHLAAIESEKEVLSMMMNYADDVIPVVRAEIVSDDFCRPEHRLLYTRFLEMYQKQIPIEPSTVAAYFETTGDREKLQNAGVKVAYFLSDIICKALGKTALDYHMGIVKDRARRIKSIKLLDLCVAQALDLTNDYDAHKFLVDMAQVTADRYIQERTIKDIALDFLTEVEERATEDRNFCVMSGINILDTTLHGFRRQELIYLAGRPSMGKSALALQVAVNAAREQGKQVLYVSLEMGERQLFGRAVSNLTGINSETVMYAVGLVDTEEYSAVLNAATELSEIGLHIETREVNTPRGIYNRALQVQGKHGLDMIIIDHVHLMDSGRKDNESQNVNMSRISRELKSMAIDLDIPILALAQLSRGVESRSDKHPLLSDLRDSGSLEQDADKVIMLYRQSYYEPVQGDDIVEIMVKKHRDGRLGNVRVKFEKECSRMTAPDFGGSYEDPGFTAPA